MNGGDRTAKRIRRFHTKLEGTIKTIHLHFFCTPRCVLFKSKIAGRGGISRIRHFLIARFYVRNESFVFVSLGITGNLLEWFGPYSFELESLLSKFSKFFAIAGVAEVLMACRF